MSMFLNRDEIAELTGFKHKAKQRDWLVESGFKFTIRADGFPCVLRSHIEKSLGGSLETKRLSLVEPDADALRRQING